MKISDILKKNKERQIYRDIFKFSREGEFEKLRILLLENQHIDPLDSYLVNSLNVACEIGHFEIFKLLANIGVMFDVEGSFQSLPMHRAASSGSIEIMRYLNEKGVSYDVHDSRKRTPIMVAVFKNQKEVFSFLLLQSVSLNEQDNDGLTALHIASYNNNIYCVLEILNNNANPYIFDNNGLTAFHIACKNGHIEVANIFLQKAIDINHRSLNGEIALLLASKDGKSEMVEFLVDNGADIEVTDPKGKTFLMDLIVNGKFNLISKLSVSFLNKKDLKGYSALHYACETNNIKAVKAIIKNGGNLDITDNLNRTPLMLSIRNGYSNISTMLIENGADTTIKDSDGKDAFDYIIGNIGNIKLEDESCKIIKSLIFKDYHKYIKILKDLNEEDFLNNSNYNYMLKILTIDNYVRKIFLNNKLTSEELELANNNKLLFSKILFEYQSKEEKFFMIENDILDDFRDYPFYKVYYQIKFNIQNLEALIIKGIFQNSEFSAIPYEYLAKYLKISKALDSRGSDTQKLKNSMEFFMQNPNFQNIGFVISNFRKEILDYHKICLYLTEEEICLFFSTIEFIRSFRLKFLDFDQFFESISNDISKNTILDLPFEIIENIGESPFFTDLT